MYTKINKIEAHSLEDVIGYFCSKYRFEGMGCTLVCPFRDICVRPTWGQRYTHIVNMVRNHSEEEILSLSGFTKEEDK